MTTDLITARLTDTHFDAAIAHLRTLNRKAFLGYAITVGQYVADTFFAGDFDALHDKSPDKLASFQAFVVQRGDELAELDLSASTLRNYVAAAEVYRGLPEHLAGRLGIIHLRQLAVVTDTTERKRLAHDAATMHWTRDQVAIAVKDWKTQQRKGNKKPGPKHKPAVLKAATAVHTAIRHLVKLHGAAKQLGDAHRVVLDTELRAAQAALAGLVDGGR